MSISVWFAILALGILLSSCISRLTVIPADVISEKTTYDSDDPAIWVNPKNPSESIVFGTDKDTDGAVYAFNLQGEIIEEKTLRNIKRPNNIDIEYQVRLNDSTTADILVVTEREQQQLRIYSVPEMLPLDGGGLKVFEDEAELVKRLPMGIAVYKSPLDNKVYVIVSRKTGPEDNYLYQYQLLSFNGQFGLSLVRKFGRFSGEKEIEAIAVDDAASLVYYADEGVCIRKYHAEPSMGDEELSCFGREYFRSDIEGIAIAKDVGGEGFLIVSDQQRGQFNVFSATDNRFVKAVNLGTSDTDGCDVITTALSPTFSTGLFVAMSNDKTYHFFDLQKLGLADK
ncbi:phytase [Eudoraea adriatica]|uniref:phytase n=1 Tax=Eudoraea adriatica TaxID=446681 RepID=UPI00037B21AF|nr:phytase [Eudoraea adriatica]